jgi:hypothetical protein
MKAEKEIKSVDCEIKSPDVQAGAHTWMQKDLQKSGLSNENFTIESFIREAELKERLGFTSISGTSITTVGGYWIPYLNAPGYYRLKLRSPITTKKGTIKYLSPKKEMGFGNKPYILPQVKKLLESYNPDKPVFITEGEKKAAKATLEGFPCVGLSGVWNFKDSENEFLPELDECIWKDRSVYIVFDSDISDKHSVKQAEIRLAINLLNRGAIVLSVRLPNEENGDKNGLDDYLVRYESDEFRKLVDNALPTLEVHAKDSSNYKIILKELTCLNNEIIKVQTFKTLAKKLNVNMNAIETEYRKLLPQEETEKQKIPEEQFTSEQIEKAKTLLNSPDILSKMLEFTKRQGFIGEELNQMLLYLSFTSRFFSKHSISTIVKGQSASGKSHLVGTILNLFTTTDVINLSFITAKALFHRQGDLNHKILFIAEHTGGESADYSIRTALSEGEISIMIPEKSEESGKWETVEKRIPAKGLVFVETTTKSKVHHENQTRLFDLYTDDSEEQTKNILFMQAKQIELLKPDIIEEGEVWRAAQSILENNFVYIPYATEIAKAFPTSKIRARRDFSRLLSLISSHTLLYQYQRNLNEQGRLVAELQDVEAILPLAETILSQSMKELSPKQEKAILILQKEFSDKEFSTKEAHVKTEEIAAYSTLQTWFKQFIKDGILEWNNKRGADSRYTFIEPDKLLGNTSIFSSNLLESLNNDYLESELGNDRQLGNETAEEPQLPDNLELPKLQDEVDKSNDNSELHKI